MKPMTITPIAGVQCFSIGREAVITLCPELGMVIVSTVFHQELNGMHYWQHRGNETLAQFLITSDVGYIIKKLFEARRLREFDAERTTKCIQERIIQLRMDSGVGGSNPSAEQAREWWDDAMDISEAEDVRRLDWLGDEWYEYILESDTSVVGYFEKMIWGPFIAHLKSMEVALAKP